MAQYIVDSADRATEVHFTDYRDDRGGVQSQAGQMYAAIVRSETAYTALDEALSEGGTYSAIADYHSAVAGPVAASVTILRAKMAELTAFMRAMQSAMPEGVDLFPGVPRNE